MKKPLSLRTGQIGFPDMPEPKKTWMEGPFGYLVRWTGWQSGPKEHEGIRGYWVAVPPQGHPHAEYTNPGVFVQVQGTLNILGIECDKPRAIAISERYPEQQPNLAKGWRHLCMLLQQRQAGLA